MKLSISDIIKQFKNVHSDEYCYDLVDYINSHIKVKIICKYHGVFEQAPNHHKRGSKCPICSNEKKRLGLKSLIDQFNIIHNYKYDYSLVDYINDTKKVKIICKEHGIFEQTPNNHKNGQNCPKCSPKFRNGIKFKKDGNHIHNYKYDYSLVDYTDVHTRVKIICKYHGVFEQIPHNHLNGSGCSKCSRINSRLNNKKFIQLSNEIHNNRYDYSLVDYKLSKNKVKIICEDHGVFEQNANNHLNGKGCPMCKSSKGEKMIRQYLKENDILFEEQKKFENLKNINYLRFDFYLPDYNTCIEYDGIQHFKIVEHFGSRTSFMKLKYHDKLKNKYCKENNIRLIRIPYTEYNNIKNIIKQNEISKE